MLAARAQFVGGFGQYRALMRATHGNGCDLVYNDFVLRAGGSYERNKEEAKLKSAQSVRAIVHGIFVATLVLKERA